MKAAKWLCKSIAALVLLIYGILYVIVIGTGRVLFYRGIKTWRKIRVF